MEKEQPSYLLTLPSYMKPERQSISVDLIAKRNVVQRESLTADELVEEIMKLNHIRLDRENIQEIDNLECLGTVTHLYLQHNGILKIENLELLTQLRFLTLANNRIKRIENIKHLLHLRFLDLSENEIEEFSEEELPKSLIIFSLCGNPCSQLADYRHSILRAIPDLEQLDGVMLTRQDKLLAGCHVETESDEDDEEEDGEDGEAEGEDTVENEEAGELSLHSDLRPLRKHTDDILVRAKIRAIKADAAHMKRIDQLEELRNQTRTEKNIPSTKQ